MLVSIHLFAKGVKIILKEWWIKNVQLDKGTVENKEYVF